MPYPRFFYFYRSTCSEQQDLDLTSEPLSTINERYSQSSISTSSRSTSFTLIPISKKSDLPVAEASPLIHVNTSRQPIIANSRPRHNGPLIQTKNKIYSVSQSNPDCQPVNSTNVNTLNSTSQTEQRGRVFVHRADSRPFVLGAAIQMKPINGLLLSNEKRRPCHRQNALRYKSTEQDIQSRVSAPVIINHNPVKTSSRCQSSERRLPSSSQPMKSFSFDINNELRPSDISWSVREKARLFEHSNQHKLSTGRENYV